MVFCHLYYIFNVFVSDLGISLSSANIGCHINNVGVSHLFYADDFVLMAPSPSVLQTLINISDVFAKENEIMFNTRKLYIWLCYQTVWNIFMGLLCFVNNRQLRWVSEQNYLGIFINSNSSDDRDVKWEVHSILHRRGNTLIIKFRKCSGEVKSSTL